eukprot:853666-Pleurochrysis_carterae.AAC.1
MDQLASEHPLGWEVYNAYNPAPIERCPARYATPLLSICLCMGKTVHITQPFVSLLGSKVGFNPSTPSAAQVVCLLLGGTWNSTNQHADKRRWVLVEHGGDCTKLRLTPRTYLRETRLSSSLLSYRQGSSA